MRVLFWSDLFWPYIGGSEIFAAKLLMALRERHEFVVVTRQDSPDLPAEESYDGIPVYRLPFYTAMASGDLKQLIRLRQQVAGLKRNFAPDLIHIHNFGPSILFHHETADARSAPMLFTVQLEISPYKKAGPDTLLEQTLRAADWVNCVSSETLAQVRQRVPQTSPRSSVVFNALHVPSLLPRALPLEPPRLLCLGRLQRQKGFDLALSALAEIIDRFPSARLIIAGDGPERGSLERQVADLHLTGAVDFVGWVSPDEVPALIDSAMMVIIPSRYEGLPLIGLEAALMARPIVASRISGLSEIVLHEKTGFLVEPEGTAGLVEAIVFLLTHPRQAAQMGQAGRCRTQELFSWEQCVDDYNALYGKLVSRQSSVKHHSL
jgi:glycogen(starch) synthase